jgi:hypothetical protein
MKNLYDKISSLKQEIVNCENEIKEQIYNAINEVANEHKRPKISKHIFIVNYSELSGQVWDASFYDWERSAEILIKKMNNVRPLDMVDSIKSIYKNRLKNGVAKIKMTHREYWGRNNNWYYNATTEYPVKSEFIKEVLLKLGVDDIL